LDGGVQRPQFRDMRTCPSLFSRHEAFHFHGWRAMVLQLICFVTGRFHDMRTPTLWLLLPFIQEGIISRWPLGRAHSGAGEAVESELA
jgi:hypothetical protein